MHSKKRIVALSLVATMILVAAVTFTKRFTQGCYSFHVIIACLMLAYFSAYVLLLLVLYKKGHRKSATNILICFLASTVIYVIADITAGYFLIIRPTPVTIPDEYVHHRLIPNISVNFVSGEYNYVQRINNLGLRGRDIQLAKEAAVFRVIMLGDSFTMGKGVGDEETFSSLLEKSLNEETSRHVEVVNAGVDSYAPLLSLFQLGMYLSHLTPDLVVLNLDMSDLLQESVYRNHATYLSDGNIKGVDGQSKKAFFHRAKVWIYKNLYMTRMVVLGLKDMFQAEAEVSIEDAVFRTNPNLLKHTLADDERDRSVQWAKLFRSIMDIKNYCEGHGVKFLLTVYPWGHQVSEKEWIPGRYAFIPKNAKVSDKSVHRVEQFATQNYVDMLNVFPAFRSFNSEGYLYYRYDPHWTPTGHKIMARELEKYILETYLAGGDSQAAKRM